MKLSRFKSNRKFMVHLQAKTLCNGLHLEGKAYSGSNSSVVQGPPNLKVCTKLVDSMPKRIKMLLNNCGGHVMY